MFCKQLTGELGRGGKQEFGGERKLVVRERRVKPGLWPLGEENKDALTPTLSSHRHRPPQRPIRHQRSKPYASNTSPSSS
jgi:hypothetical protein